MSNETIDAASNGLWKRACEIYIQTANSDEERNQAQRYFSMITSVTRKDNTFTILTSNSFAAGLLRESCLEKIKSCMLLASGESGLKIEIFADENSKPAIVLPVEVKPISQSTTPSTFISPKPLNPEFTFDEFVAGPSNSWARAAAMGVAENPGNSGYNPLFIHGGTGLGKTHLMQAIGNQIRRDHPNLAVCYLTAETFLNEFVNASQNGNITEFRHRFRNIDVLLVDDIQFLQRGKQIQEEFFNTFNALRDSNPPKQIVMTSDVSPKNLPQLDERLISRFIGGMVQEIENPVYETRLAILKKKAEGHNPPIPMETLNFIADKIASHVRAIEGALQKVELLLKQDPMIHLNEQLLTHLLADFIEEEQTRRNLTIEEVQSVVAKKYMVTLGQILSPERTQSIVTPRQLAMYIARKYTNKSLQEIADKFTKKHATIIHGVKSIETRLDVEPELKTTLKEILVELRLAKEGADI